MRVSSAYDLAYRKIQKNERIMGEKSLKKESNTETIINYLKLITHSKYLPIIQ